MTTKTTNRQLSQSELNQIASIIGQQVIIEVRRETPSPPLASGTPLRKILWDSKDCARYLRVSTRHFAEKLSYHHEFPKPVKLPSETGKRGHRRWYAKEVIQWLERRG